MRKEGEKMRTMKEKQSLRACVCVYVYACLCVRIYADNLSSFLYKFLPSSAF